MVKCAVSGCPNRADGGHRGLAQRPPKRFFDFPVEPTRVKVWLAALRKTDLRDSAEQRFICEDHFLPGDLSAGGVKDDAIPIMPAFPDGAPGLTSPWAAESSEEDEEEEEERGGDRQVGRESSLQGPGTASTNPLNPEKTSPAQPHLECSTQTKKVSRHDASLGLLTRGFLKLLQAAPDGSLDIREVAASLRTRKRRVYDITNVLDGIQLVRKESANRIQWTGKTPISDFLWKNQQKFQRELDNLKMVEDTLDGLIKTCARQLFEMTDDPEASPWAYVTLADLGRLRVLRDQTVIVVKAPEETKLEIPAPKEDQVQVHLKAGKGPILVVACEVGSGEAATSDPGRTANEAFLTLEESRVKTSALQTVAES